MFSLRTLWEGSLNRLSNHFHGTPYEQRRQALEDRQEQLIKMGENPEKDPICQKLEREAERLLREESKPAADQGLSLKRP